MDNDDQPVGRVLTRREALAVLGSSSLAMFVAACTPASDVATVTPTSTSSGASSVPAGTSTARAAATSTAATTSTAAPQVAAPSCIVKPELTIGPYFVDERLNRSDIRPDPTNGRVSAGVPLEITFRVAGLTSNSCTALSDAVIDVWQCDALGEYSDVEDNVGQKFLRGYQATDANGVAKFTTVYPGWYRGRTVHIHFKIVARRADGRSEEFVSQLFFDDALTDQVFQQAPYSSRGNRDTRNANDMIFRGSNNQLTLAPTLQGGTYVATFDIGMQVSA